MARHRSSNPEGVVDPDRGSALEDGKQAEVIDFGEAMRRSEERAGLRELDAMTETMSGLTRAQRDSARISPRGTVAPLGHWAKERRIPREEEPRVPLSSRQKKARSKAKHQVRRGMREAQLRAQWELTHDPGHWGQINDQLSDAAGDLGTLSEGEQQRVRRVDRSIQAYERQNDRGHVLYCNVAMPGAINHTNLESFVDTQFEVGEAVEFDRYTMTTHQLHELHADPSGRTAVFEIQSRRGAYLGKADRSDDTAHLLPRAMRLQIVGVRRLRHQGPDGRVGERVVIQLRDITTDGEDEKRGSR